MLKKIKAVSHSIGVDGAVLFTIMARVVQAGGGVISIIFISRYLSKVEQGYYFTFGSILAIQIFFELGLSNIITQFVAHEMADLRWETNSLLTGSDESKSRLSSLLRFCVKWFFVMALILAIILVVVGYWFFFKYSEVDRSINWQMPWLIISITTGCSLILSPILAFCEGLGKVKEVAMIRLGQQSCQLLFLLAFLFAGFKLFASPLAAIVSLSIAPMWILFSYNRTLLRSIWNMSGDWKVNYKSEIFPYQWRIALSWISGYFIFQLFNPVLFATEGAVTAGQMGMTLAGLNGILSISLSWINTKVPLFSNLIARRQFGELDDIFGRTTKQASSICGICLLIFCLVVYGMQSLKMSFGTRFLPLLPLALLCLATFINQFVSALATYLRCHKEEPFLRQSITLGILTALSTLIFGRKFGLNGMVIGYSSLMLFVSLPWSLNIFVKKRNIWHNE